MNSKANILLVDDQPARLLSYDVILGGLDYNLVHAHSGIEALKLLMTGEFAVILLDVNMPEMDGFETASMIHQHPRHEKTPIIFVTGVHVTDMDRLRGYKLGAFDYVYVPVVPEILRAKVSVLVELYDKRRELQKVNDDLAQANAALVKEKERELDKLNASLQTANDALRQADRRKDEFLAMLAHELRNPLAPLRMVADMMGPSDNLSTRHDEMLQIMRHQVHVMVRLVDDLMEVSRVTRGKILLQRRVADLRDIIRDAVEISRPLIDACKHELTLRLPPTPLTVNVDTVRIAQVVANLLNNAAKYTPDGGRISIEADPDGAAAVVRVRDNGIGMPSELIPDLFNLFVQGEVQSSRAKGGLGIGLSLVRDLVKLHDGDTSASSDGAGKGSLFVVRLPMFAGADARASDETPASPMGELVHKRVLIVDDNESACAAVKFAVELLGAEAIGVHDAHAALRHIGEFRPSLVFLDLGLPGMDGHELAREIRRNANLVQPRLVAITGWGHEQVRLASREAGIDEHLVKPIGIKDVERLLVGTSHS
ncbi:MAG TPA: response regulator [Rudaea sp.]|jgi:signal transduction histidine kinase|nr:response regulator [Rudaea sp.]